MSDRPPFWWDDYFLGMAQEVAKASKDPSSKVGAILTRDKFRIGDGFNGFPQKLRDDYELLKNRDEKYPRIIHAELNAIFAAKQDLSGCTCYCTLPSCSRCAANLIQVGVTRVVFMGDNIDYKLRWKTDLDRSRAMFREAGVEYWEVG